MAFQIDRFRYEGVREPRGLCRSLARVHRMAVWPFNRLLPAYNPLSGFPSVFIIVLALTGLLPPQEVAAQPEGNTYSRLLNPEAPVPNGTLNDGNVVVDFRGVVALGITPQVLIFSQTGQTQQLSLQAYLIDRSSFTVNSTVYPIVFSVSTPAVAAVSPIGLVTALNSGSTVVEATAFGQTVQSIVLVSPSMSEVLPTFGPLWT